jgi:hypothetical protein
MIKGSQINRQTLLEQLSKGFCKVQFRKVSSGQYRSLVCTLDHTKIPAKHKKSIVNTLNGGDDPDLLPVFDMVSRGWKSFYISNVLYMYTEDDLTAKNDKKTKQKEEKEDIIGEPNPKMKKNNKRK